MRLHRSRKKADPDPSVLPAQLGSVVLYGTFALLLFGLWLTKQWLEGEIKVLWNPLFLPMAAFAVLILLQFVLRISVYPHDSIAQAMLYCAYAMLCFLANQNLLRAS